ncbi:MAG: hypothetical protein IJY39_09225 [Clostridia bacterium]|nr:hypothetical protein [Clostridia bacterium]
MLYLALANEKSLFEELWEYFVDRYFTLDMPYLENFTLGTTALNTLRWLIIGITFGIIFASISTVYNKRYIGEFVRKLMYEECFNAETAKTLYDLGYLKSPGIRGVIKSGGSLSRWVRCVEEDEFLAEVEKKRAEYEEAHKDDPKKQRFKAPEFKRDCNTMHFYLPEEKKYAAEIKFDDQGANVGTAVLTVILAIVLCAFIFYMLPDVIKLIDNFISVMKGN